MQAEVTIEMTGLGLEILAGTQLHINLAQHARGPAGSDVTWLAIAPTALNNIVRWDTEAFAVYMANTLPFPGETIRVQHTLSAKLGWMYTFDGAGFFGFPGGPADVCTIVNQGGPNLFFGLAYRADVNGRSILAPINVAQLPGGTVEFAPAEEITVFFALTPFSGSVRTVPPREAWTVKPDAKFVFDDQIRNLRIA